MFTHFLNQKVSLPAAGLLAYFQMQGYFSRAKWIKVDYDDLAQRFDVSPQTIRAYISWLYNTGFVEKKREHDEDYRRGGPYTYIALNNPPFEIYYDNDTDDNTYPVSDCETLDIILKDDYLKRYREVKKFKDETGGAIYPLALKGQKGGCKRKTSRRVTV